MGTRESELLTGRGTTLTAFVDTLERVARSDATVLLVGESGAGKGRAARHLHARSPRSGGPLVEIHLGALPESLVESELFGHVRGAFTDAHQSRRGCFERAHGGTLVLDDIDLLPRESQVKLLRALQERVVEPLGSEQAIAVDTRVVATTNRNLAALVESGELREDLYYRLAVVPLEVPPLRAHLEDLPELAAHLAAAAAERLGVPARSLGEAALARLAEHPWPGNVRELENALERVLVLGAGAGEVGEIRADELAFLGDALEGIADDLARSALAHGLTVDELARAMMDRALAESRGNVSAAARRVGLTRRAFEYRLAGGGGSKTSENGGD